MLALVATVVIGVFGSVAAEQLRHNVRNDSTGLHYDGNGVKMSMTPSALKAFHDFGYTFPVVNGQLKWCHNKSRKCVEFIVLKPDASALSLHIMEVPTPEGRRVLLCRSFTLKQGGFSEIPLIFIPEDRSLFLKIDPRNEVVKKNCPFES